MNQSLVVGIQLLVSQRKFETFSLDNLPMLGVFLLGPGVGKVLVIGGGGPRLEREKDIPFQMETRKEKEDPDSMRCLEKS